MRTDRSAAAVYLTLALLVVIGVVGRWGQPDWSVTPLAAVGLLAGFVAPTLAWAIAAPLLAITISNLLLPPYQNLAVGVTVYFAFAGSAVIGRLLRRPIGSWQTGLARLAACAAAPAVLFYLTTNFAVWATQGIYAKSLAGLTECYVAALPFFRQMLVGDLAYVAVLFTAAALAGVYSLTPSARELEAEEPVTA